MSKALTLPVSDLTLDLSNFRTVKQPTEDDAISAIIATSPDRFWALTESLLADGFLPTENIIVLKSGGRPATNVVREGNRRVAAMKLLLGLVKVDPESLPAGLADRIRALPKKWRTDHATVPCLVYGPKEATLVDRVVTLAHGKGEKAGREQWNAVARARHNRDAGGGSEPGLDLLEKYLTHGKNLTPAQGGRWSGDYPITVLDEAMKRLAPRLGVKNAPDLAKAYPTVSKKTALDSVLHAIGQKKLGFKEIRDGSTDFGASYGIPEPAAKKSQGGQAGTGSGAASGASSHTGQRKGSTKTKSASADSPTAVKRALKAWAPKGSNREKVEALRLEASRLDLKKTPMAFCFVLRSMFELSAYAYCDDHAKTGGPTRLKSNGDEKKLVTLLGDISDHIRANSSDPSVKKVLHGAMTELGKSAGILSVTSMNQLVHNPRFSVQAGDVAVLFGNVFPLLQAMSE
jgi:hypothetical protein